MRLLSVLLLALCLAACGQIPRPFMGATLPMTADPLHDIPTAMGIAVTPVRGVPEPLSGAISRAAANRLQTFDIPAEAIPTNPGLGFTLSATATRAEVTPAGRVLDILWTLTSRRGDPAGSHRQTLTIPEDAWANGTGDSAVLLGGEAASAIAALLGATTPAAPVQQPAKPNYPTVSVTPVEGAPGDGREALRLAVIQVLNEQGVRRDDVNPDVTLSCQLTATPLDGGLQKVEIVWRATTRAGADLGTMRLDNSIPNGALDGPWGPTAFAIADAAAADLLTLITSTPPAPSPSGANDP